MNKTFKLLENLTKYSSGEMFAENFFQNLKRFEFILNEKLSNPRIAIDFDDFLNLMPDYVVDLSKNPDCLLSLYAESEVQDKVRVATVKPLEDDEIFVTFKFNNYGKLLSITFKSADKCLILDSNQDLVTFERKNLTLKLVNLFKDYFALNAKKSPNTYFNTILSIEKETLDNKIMYSKMLLGI